MISRSYLVVLFLAMSPASAFRFQSVLGSLFPPKAPTKTSQSVKSVPASLKQELLTSVSGTNNGKSATPEQQAKVLSLVRTLETEFPSPRTLLTDSSIANDLLDGTWYLQYTSPSNVGDKDAFPNSWKPQIADENSNIPTKQFNAQGSISAAGIKVDTSNRVVKQNIDVQKSRIANVIGFDWGRVQVSGAYRPSSNVVNRALVAFDTALFDVNDGPTINLGFLFSAIAFFRRTKDNGWLETTFIDKDIRIGRGNKGTMFVLTREADAVKP